MNQEIPQLHKIAAMVKFAHGCELYDIRGIKDTPQKFSACYLAKKLTKADSKIIGKFFQINPDFMEDQVQGYAVQLLMDQKAKKIHEDLEQLFWEMELANVRS